MTHSLHRRSAATEVADFVVVVMAAKGLNDQGAAAKLRTVLDLAAGHGAVNIGDMKNGSVAALTPGELAARLHDHSILDVVFAESSRLASFLAELRRAELGLSVVVSGPLAEVLALCRERPECGVPHTVSLSLGVWGRTDLLPPRCDLDVTTLCGHALVAPAAVAGARGAIACGSMTAEQAAAQLARPCVCGAFNPCRAAALLRAEEAARCPLRARADAIAGEL